MITGMMSRPTGNFLVPAVLNSNKQKVDIESDEIKAGIRNSEANLLQPFNFQERLEIRRGINIDKQRLLQLEAQRVGIRVAESSPGIILIESSPVYYY